MVSRRFAGHGQLVLGLIRPAGAMLAWIFSGVFQRFPNIKIALSEGHIGWMPYFIERAEQVIDTQRHWVNKSQPLGNIGQCD